MRGHSYVCQEHHGPCQLRRYPKKDSLRLWPRSETGTLRAVQSTIAPMRSGMLTDRDITVVGLRKVAAWPTRS